MLKSLVVINLSILKMKNERNFNLLFRHSDLCVKWAASRMLGGEDTWVSHDLFYMKFPKPSRMCWKVQRLFFISVLGVNP
jgi:hypothetical protein